MNIKNIYCLILLFLILSLLSVINVYAQSPDISENIRQLTNNIKPLIQDRNYQNMQFKESPRYSFTYGGYLSYLSAPPSHYFPVTMAVPGRPEETARNFIKEHSMLFGVISESIDFTALKSRKKDNRNYVHFEQTYRGIPVFGGQLIVQLNEIDGVEYLTSDIAINIDDLDKGIIPLIPTISSDEAIELIRDIFITKNQGLTLTITPPILKIYDPSILGNSGGLQLVWDMNVFSEDDNHVNDQILLDAHTGEISLKYTLNIPVLQRNIFDSNNTTSDPGILVRSDVQTPPGPGPTGIVDADNAFDYSEDTYNFYWNNHSRDGIDNNGMLINSTVRFCSSNINICGTPPQCPCNNAFWNGSRLYYGQGYPSDDIVGHEYTHGVTQFESGLIYMNQSGAINESFSDIWGEFIDLTNGVGTDTQGVRWLIGEDAGGAIRSMSNPPLYFNPDRMGSIFYYNGTNDNGGVHINSGVGNKLAYLLTDGETFNGHSISGVGIDRVADLYYEVNTNLLTAGANYENLCDALSQAAKNLSWTIDERNNIDSACSAVEIYGKYIYVDKSNVCILPNGEMACFLWSYGGPYTKVTDGVNAANYRAKLFIKTGSYNEQLTIDKVMELHAWDGEVTIGQ